MSIVVLTAHDWAEYDGRENETEFNANDFYVTASKSYAHPVGLMLAITMNTLCRLRERKKERAEDEDS